MWIVLKGKNKEIDFLQNNLIKKMGKDIMFYIPRYKTEIFKKNKVVTSTQLLMKNYIFCYHKNFKKRDNLNTVNFTKGLEYILKGHEIPRSGLNFLGDDEKKFNTKFLLLCGVEKFRNFYVRVDILERLFLKIIENTKKKSPKKT